MASNRPKLPANFVDLRPGAKKPKKALIQDILGPNVQTRWRQALNLRLSFEFVVLLFIIFAIWQVTKPSNPLPKKIQAQTHFAVFVPKSLPKGFSQPGGYSYNAGVLTFTVDKSGSKQILVSEQAEPSDFDISQFDQGQIKAGKTLNSKYGTAYLGNLEGSQIGSLVSYGTWVFVSQPKQVGNTDDISVIIQSLHKY